MLSIVEKLENANCFLEFRFYAKEEDFFTRSKKFSSMINTKMQTKLIIIHEFKSFSRMHITFKKLISYYYYVDKVANCLKYKKILYFKNTGKKQFLKYKTFFYSVSPFIIY